MSLMCVYNKYGKVGSNLDLTYVVPPNLGYRYGLLGPNGQGKTTLLKHMAQRKIRGISPNISVLLVEQELAFGDETTVVQAVLRADKKTKALLGMGWCG